MKYFIYLIDCLIIICLPLLIITGIKDEVKVIRTTLDIKKVNSLKLNTVIKNIEEKKVEEIDEELVESDESLEVSPIDNVQKEEEKNTMVKEEVSTEEPEEKVSDVLETLTGSMSGYGTDCNGCSGFTSSGYNIKSSIYYQDSTYGKVRILSGDRSLKFGSIIRIKNSKLGEIIGIVLDRGSSVGIGKAHLFDLLFSSEKEAQAYEVSYHVTFEVLRYGY